MSELKKPYGGIYCRLDTAEDKSNEHEDRAIEKHQKKKEKKIWKKIKQSIRNIWNMLIRETKQNIKDTQDVIIVSRTYITGILKG